MSVLKRIILLFDQKFNLEGFICYSIKIKSGLSSVLVIWKNNSVLCDVLFQFFFQIVMY